MRTDTRRHKENHIHCNITSMHCFSFFFFFFLELLIKKVVKGASVTGVPGDAVQYGVIQFGDKVYPEIPLGSAHNLQEFMPKVMTMKFRNDSYNDVEAAIEAATEMLENRYVTAILTAAMPLQFTVVVLLGYCSYATSTAVILLQLLC